MSTLRQRYPIPGRLNLALCCAVCGTCCALLWWASHASSSWGLAAAAFLFSYTANTCFSLLHEAVHGSFHENPQLNAWCGRLAAAFFPTAFSIQRAFHLVHHRNNRSESERFDYFQDGDVRWLKYAQWYAILTGVYWAMSVLGTLVYLLVPRILRARVLRAPSSRTATQTAAGPYFTALEQLHPVWTRGEVLLSLSIQVGLFFSLDLNVLGWLCCYGAFGLRWSSLQYADHAFSPLDSERGAWNLRVNRWTRGVFLNYHYHLAHHQHPQVPWLHLPRLVAPGDEQPSYLKVWLAMWRGPRPMPAGPAP